MKKIRHKHNKKRNTAFLYESLIRELSKSMVRQDEDRKKIIISLIKEHFSPNTLLGKELELFKSIYETEKVDVYTAEKVLKEVKDAYNKINKKQVYKAQTRLINIINKKLSSTAFANFLPNYRHLATISQIFNDTPIKDRVILEGVLVRKMATIELSEKKEMKPVGSLAYKTFINKFNDTYSAHLLSEQKELLQRYILSFGNNGLELKLFLNEEVGRLKEEVQKMCESAEVKNDSSMREKAEKVLNILKEFKNSNIDQHMLKKILKIQNLVKENSSDDS